MNLNLHYRYNKRKAWYQQQHQNATRTNLKKGRTHNQRWAQSDLYN